MAVELFLGGTVGKNPWRAEFTQRLVSAGIGRAALFDPVRQEWNREAQIAEEQAKAEARFLLFYIGHPMQKGISISGYSLVEATMALYDRPAATVIVFDKAGFTGRVLAAMNQCEHVLRRRFPAANIFEGLRDAEAFILAHLTRKDRMQISHGSGPR